MEFFRQTQVDFMKIRKITAVFSAVVMLLCLTSLFTKGINWGLDFTGGIVIELDFPQDADVDSIRNALQKDNFKDAQVQTFGSAKDIMIKLAPREGVNERDVAKKVLDIVQSKTNAATLKRVDAVGSQVGQELTHQGFIAVLIALGATMIYIGLRFERRFAMSSAVSLAHDPIIILGIFSFFNIEFDLASLASILAVIGYSLNDTIVVFDRIKENFLRVRKASSKDIVNLSINQTLSRTIMTSGLTSLVVIALLIFGGPTLFGFSLSFFIGIIVGTYSSIYVSGALALTLGLVKEDLMATEKFSDGMP